MPDNPPEHSSSRAIRFWHAGQVQQVSGLPATTSVLSWLREHRRCAGTKEGCNEGDCGACTVLLAELVPETEDQPAPCAGAAGIGTEAASAASAKPNTPAARPQRLRLKPINSCIQFLPTLDGKALVTVEELGGAHPAQQALVACHGSQCGFCTPGFVMSLVACHHRHSAGPADGAVPSRQQLADDLSGNLCRCTGYRPILDAGQHMFSLPNPPLPALAQLLPALQALQADLAEAPALRLAPAQAGGSAYFAPTRLDALADLVASQPQATLLAGSTDIGLWVNKQFKPLDTLVYLGAVPALQRIWQQDGQLHIGAMASLQDAWQALAQHWPELTEMGLRFASRPVREAGTLGGNLANGSPIGDSAPVLMALGAQLLLRHGHQQRRLPLDSFYLGYQRKQLAPGEFIQAIELPLPTHGAAQQPAQQTVHLRAYKLSKRYDCDISALACGLWLQLGPGDDGGPPRVLDARLAFGGMAATVQRARGAEAALLGQPWTEPTLQRAQAALAQDFSPLSDLRASAGYRQRAAANLLRRFWLETRPEQPLAQPAVSVWCST